MGYNLRAKMPASQRAKQFMPFSAVKGLEEALARQERKARQEDRPELGEEQIGAINRALCRLEKGTEGSITYYSLREYRTLIGTVDKVDEVRQALRVSGNIIPFEDICEITLSGFHG